MNDPKYKSIKYNLPFEGAVMTTQVVFTKGKNDTEVIDPEVIDPRNITLSTVVNDAIEGDGYAEFDPASMVFICHVPSYVTIVDINRDAILEYYLSRSQTKFSDFYGYPNLLSIQIDDTKKPCCIWYSPSQSQIANNSEQVSHYPYDKARKQPGCFNPDLTGSKQNFQNCNYPPSRGGFNSCPSNTLDIWQDITLAYDGDNLSYTIQRCYFSNRIPQYRILNHSDNDIAMSPTEDIAAVLAEFEKLTDGMIINSSASSKVSYFKTVLSN